jgi:hypothetical protein
MPHTAPTPAVKQMTDLVITTGPTPVVDSLTYIHKCSVLPPSWFCTPRQKDNTAKALIQFDIASIAVC